jgi:uncharacterized protein YjiK
MSLFYTYFLWFNWCCSFAPTPTLHPIAHQRLTLAEPSDICAATNGNGYFLVGNTGGLQHISNTGVVLTEKKPMGADFEGAAVFDNKLWVINESLRELSELDTLTFAVQRSVRLTDFGARNSSFEALTYLPNTHELWAFTEKPVMLYRLNDNLQLQEQRLLPQFKEVSAATFYAGALWLLSDEGHCIYKVNPADFSIEKTWNLNIINPEGIAFNAKGELLILSDDRQMLYTFAPFL